MKPVRIVAKTLASIYMITLLIIFGTVGFMIAFFELIDLLLS